MTFRRRSLGVNQVVLNKVYLELQHKFPAVSERERARARERETLWVNNVQDDEFSATLSRVFLALS